METQKRLRYQHFALYRTGVYELFEVHYASLVERNAIIGRKVRVIDEFVGAIKNKPARHLYPRFTPSQLISAEDEAEQFSLSLPPCQVCKEPRLSETAKFCSSCGSRLKSVSIFETLINQDIENLPLTKCRVDSIKENS